MASRPLTKADLRAQAVARRRAMTPHARKIAGAAIARAVLDLPQVVTARSVAAYLAIGTEPPTADLVEALWSRGTRVILPLLRDDLDLDWAEYDGPGRVAQGLRGLWTPTGPRLGVHAVATTDVLLVPALAVDRSGRRLGRGGGSYDRALARVPAGRPVVALLYAGELHPGVPVEPHDRPVTAAALPSGVSRF
ncbi:MAG: 5-formyltetrahydrofolate cyclo-ligase [Actinomycetes bacterium]